ncbi:MAG: ribulose-phosphate 3-epimerase [Erysipelotrichaceae bacterium]|nr:ribulose-phosphate 3-epimerase [Erysipelotrichaceae bacterium]
MVKIAPSVLSANFANLQKDIDSIKDYVEYIHYDVMDGHFVPNISFGYSILNDLSQICDNYLDVHLMISDPLKYAQNFIDAGTNLITFHYEAMQNVDDIQYLITYLHEHHVDAGISIKPDTPVDVLLPFLDEIDLVLVMSVEPGFGGQSFMPLALDKIQQLKDLRHDRNYLIEVDGGINEETGKLCIDAGADVLVAGSYIFKADDRKQAIEALR